MQCYYSFYWCQELCGKLLSIQSKRPTVFFAKSNTSTFLVVLNALLQFYVKYNCIEETSRCFYHKLSLWKLFKHAELFFQNLSQEKEVLMKIWAFDLARKRWNVLNNCKWPTQFPSLLSDVMFCIIFTNFNNISESHTISDTVTDLFVTALYIVSTSNQF